MILLNNMYFIIVYLHFILKKTCLEKIKLMLSNLYSIYLNS